ncbi:hypothetical protein [Thermaerobacter composti]|uniref:Uncharacterized protein n=1 Tax=Thermaerobacter composti TaxID=554949 RepID=A0ABZ0QS75_9FIRM|nr:hypothetical protein [Thermaerobacter composti]WPD20335.1 hypothetical protein Q5761_08195 [Thermaerobacter composti]
MKCRRSNARKWLPTALRRLSVRCRRRNSRRNTRLASGGTLCGESGF